MTSVFVSYSHKDDSLWDQLQAHLAILRRQGVIDVWHDRRITAGEDFAGQIDKALNDAEVVLALVSPDFLNSDYCYDIEMTRALERHKAGEARVIPVILRPCDWQHPPLGKLKATPKDGRAITDWPNADKAFLNVVQDIRAAVQAIGGAAAAKLRTKTSPALAAAAAQGAKPRSGNLRVRKDFTDADRSRFLKEAFQYIGKFFEGSLDELASRNNDIEVLFQQVDAHKFVAEIFRGGKKRSSCRVLLRAGHGEISYAENVSAPDGTSNAILHIETTDQALVLKSILGFMDHEDQLSMEGAAEHLWEKLIEPLQR